MATRLIQIISFPPVAPAATVTLPHQINVNGRQQVPDFVAGDAVGFGVVVSATAVTVTNNNVGAAPINVWLQLQHSIPRQLGAQQTTGLVPRPFVATTGESGGGPTLPDIVDTPGVLVDIINGAALRVGRMITTGSRVEQGILTPAALPAGVTNNYGPAGIGTARTLRQATDPGNSTLTGLALGGALADGFVLTLVNLGPGTLTLANDTGSTAANRFLLPGGSNLVLGADQTVVLFYDGISTRFRVYQQTTNLPDIVDNGPGSTVDILNDTRLVVEHGTDGGVAFRVNLPNGSFIVSGNTSVPGRVFGACEEISAHKYFAAGSGPADLAVSAGGTFNDLPIFRSQSFATPPGGGSTISGLATTAADFPGFPWMSIVNQGPGDLTLLHASGLSIAANQFLLPGAVPMVIPVNGGVMLARALGGTRWYVVGKSF